jgi:Xaa-Pro aminopeptidase
MPNSGSYKQRLNLLRHQLILHNLDGFIIPSYDEFQGEYVPEYANRLKWLTGFTGSNGLVVVLKDAAAFFTDERYTIQANMEVDSHLYLIKPLSHTNISEFIRNNATKSTLIGFDARIHTEQQVQDLQQNVDCKFIGCHNLIDNIWLNKSCKNLNMIYEHSQEYSGRDSIDKIDDMIKVMDAGADAILLTDPHTVCWLLNIRAHDLNYTPILLARALLYRNCRIIVFADVPNRLDLGEHIEWHQAESIYNLQADPSIQTVQIDKKNASMAIISSLERHYTILDLPDPALMLKACKNEREVQNIIEAHKYDGVAVCKLLYYLAHETRPMTEIDISNKLLEFRSLNPHFICASFPTIAGFKSNGAIIHYHANESSNLTIKGDGLLLIDSGAQYLTGTTDVTRTIAIGKVSNEIQENYTRVLKGHISLARAHFPLDTTGSQLDVLARYALWQIGLDYGHGTGHGVGMCLSVHEGPQGISKHNKTPLKAGMVLSNEPGYYKVGEYGIRLENIMVVQKSRLADNFLEFKTITMVPFDKRLIAKHLLNNDEITWLNQYHKHIFNSIVPLISDAGFCTWLESACEAI